MLNKPAIMFCLFVVSNTLSMHYDIIQRTMVRIGLWRYVVSSLMSGDVFDDLSEQASCSDTIS
jgi:hypothetical protein